MAAAIQNSLLAALPRKSYLRLLPGLAPVELVFGDVLDRGLEAACCSCYEVVKDMHDAA